ncbi:MAG: SusD/RagB family nutrient-binding outer membrane lipoprotein, partial [Prevotellaceae bacterium]|nr:SusD/RagB family nutrient-binding outer membrane lipoprotein [Prevotellaceae bacterium]
DVAEDGTVVNSGTFYVRPDAPTHLLCYPEMCFIKAEVLFRQGQTNPAFDAYKEGIRAHMELMNEKLVGYNDPVNISKQPMTSTEINDYLSSAAVGTAADLTLGKIMMQKFIALSFSNQNWNDMRRLDYSPTIYRGWAEPYERTSGNNDKRWIPDGKQYRRLGYVSHEFNYNNANLEASHPHALLDDIRSFPVWWDYPTDDYKSAN